MLRWKYWTLIRFLKPIRSQKFIIELWLVGTLKSPIKIKLSSCYYVGQQDSSSIQDDLRLSFDEDHMSGSETIGL